MSKTIRMSGALKTELQVHMAASGRRVVTQAIADGFTQAHKDVENDYLVNGKPHSQKVGKNGLSMSSYGVGNKRVPTVTYALEWSKEYLAKRAAEPKSHSNYIGHAGNAHLENTQITDDEGSVQKWGSIDGFAPSTKYKYAWQPHTKEGLMRFLRLRVTGALTQSKGPMNYSNQQAITQNIMQIGKALAYLKLDARLSGTGATQLVSKRANPYEDSHYVVRTGSSYGNSDYSNYELLRLPNSSTRSVISEMERVLPLLHNLQAAVAASLGTNRDSKYNIQQLKLYRDSLENYETSLKTLVDNEVAEHGSTSMAIEVDTQRRAEIVEYLKAIPHKHLIATEYNAGRFWIGTDEADPAPSFKCSGGLGVDIEKRNELIESTRKTITTYEAKVAADASNLNDLKMQVAVGELKGFALSSGWIKPDITGGEEE
jgi:hypothetical protein